MTSALYRTPLPRRSKFSGVYVIRCSANDFLYVGSSDHIRARWGRHKDDLRKGKHHASRVQRCWDKHGEDTFFLEIVELVENTDDLFAREQVWINTLGAYGTPHGMNSLPLAGSARGYKWSDQARNRFSKVRTGAKPRPLPAEEKEAKVETLLKTLSNPAVHVKRGNTLRGRRLSGERLKAHTLNMQKLNEDADFAEARTIRLQQMNQTQEHKDKVVKGLLAHHARRREDPNPPARTPMSDDGRKAIKTGVQAYHAARKLDPNKPLPKPRTKEHHEAQVAGVRAYHARRREEKLKAEAQP